MTNPLPTFVVGVGRGGIEIMQTLADVVQRDGNEKYFDFVAIDTDTDTFRDVPDNTTTIELNAPNAFEIEDRQKYPYLSEEMEIGVKGAERQRPVGRYKLDSRGTPDFSDHFDTLWKSAREHLQALENDFEPNRDSYNLFLVHSMGGGTGSGTYPLLGTVLNHIAEGIEQRHDIDTYVGGVGIIPQVTQDPDVIEPKGQSIYYPNAYASLEDLSKLIEADQEALDIPLYSRSFGRGGQRTDIESSVEASFTGNSLPVDRSPFSNYWLVGVEEDLIMGGGGFSDIENYGTMVDRQVAESIQALSQMEESVENWATAVNGLATLGVLGQSEIRLPIREIREYCKLKDERKQKQERLDEGIPDDISDLESDVEYLKKVKNDPSRISTSRVNLEDPEDFVRGKLEQNLGVGSALIDGNTAEDVRSAVSNIGEEYGSAMQLLAIEILDEMFDHPSAVPAVENYWEETIENQWEGWNMNSKSEYGGSDVRTYEGKEGALEQYFDETISEYENEVESREPGALDKIPPVISLTESTREEYQRWLKNLRSAQQDLLEADSRYNRVQKMVDAADELHSGAKEDLDTRISELNSEITELEGEKRQLERETKRLDREIGEVAKDLSKRDRVGQRLSILPLKQEALDELSLERLADDLTSLDSFVGEFVREEDLQVGIEQIQSNARAWEDPTASMNYDGISPKPDRQEEWVLYHEDNEDYADEYVTTAPGAKPRRAGQSIIGYSDDPFSIQFVTFNNEGPVDALRQYQRYDQMQESGMLDSMAGKFGDYRSSYAYPEWYSRELQKSRQIHKEQTVTQPPELNPDQVTKDDLESEGERRNYIKTNGLDLFLWHGTMWEHFDYHEEDEVFQGWEQTVDGLTFKNLQQATPDEDLKARWLAGQADWGEILDAYKRNLEDQERLELIFEAKD